MSAKGDPSRLVWLLRHAKTLADPPKGGTDHDRVLAPRGRSDADALAKHLGRGGDRFELQRVALPQLVLCSSAARTRQTADKALALVHRRPDVDYLRVLYRADADGVIDQLRLVDDAVTSVMVVGHNPTAEHLAGALGRRRHADGGDFVERHGFSTCALAVFRLPPGPWRHAGLGTAKLERLVTPPY